ncbi:hypothetical protein NHP21005_16800 [Helicobacter sp. NHP21005]|uniref:hypothetical protein n=1 Tax=Helicobacter felistomachi TaxID=3040201 RepID=UPI0025723C5E|nr:hypothetical protein [Helicobacter sp. NHP21005]BEG57992.1 hypothetical protein NHP21005_16800 [Helicobacter sp. NHP21005]
MLERIFQEAHQEQRDFYALLENKGVSRLFAKGFIKKLLGLNLSAQADGADKVQKQTKSYEKYALFYTVVF